MNTHWLRGKTVAVVGASSLLGRNLIYYLISLYNCNIIAIDDNVNSLNNLKENVAIKENLNVYEFKITSPKYWDDFASGLNIDVIDIVINCKYELSRFKSFENIKIDDLSKNMSINFLTSIYSCKYLLPYLKKSKTPSIVNIVNPLSKLVKSGAISYNASLEALRAFTEMIDDEYKDFYVAWCIVNNTKTDLYKNQEESIKDYLEKSSASISNVSVKIVEGIAKKRKKILVGKRAKILFVLETYFPKSTRYAYKKMVLNKGLKLYKKPYEKT